MFLVGLVDRHIIYMPDERISNILLFDRHESTSKLLFFINTEEMAAKTLAFDYLLQGHIARDYFLAP
jgi:hypothetical protein